MAPRSRNTPKKTTSIEDSAEFKEYVDKADKLDEEPEQDLTWEDRANCGRKIHNYKLSYTDAQKQLLEAAKQETNLSYSHLLGDAAWEYLEMKYGHLAPFEMDK